MSSKELLVERLRRSKSDSQKLVRDDGFIVGTKWATESADAFELQRIGVVRSNEEHWNAMLTTSDASVYSAGEMLFFAIQPEFEGIRLAAEEFWEFILGDDIADTNNDDWLRGFAEGALSVWNSVADSV